MFEWFDVKPAGNFSCRYLQIRECIVCAKSCDFWKCPDDEAFLLSGWFKPISGAGAGGRDNVFYWTNWFKWGGKEVKPVAFMFIALLLATQVFFILK